MNEQIVLTIAQAILKNTEVLQSLVDALPHETKQAVAEKVTAGKSGAPKKAAPEPEPAVPPTPAAVAEPVVESPSEPVQPAPVVQQAPVPAPQPASVAPTGEAPFKDQQGLIQYVMAAYKAIGPQKGAQIQKVLTDLGYGNINDVKPEHYAALYAGVEALK